MPFGTTSTGPLVGKRYYPDGTSVSLGFATQYSRETSWSRADTVRRAKPADLFAGGTSRSSSRSEWTNSMGRKVESGSFILAPCNYWCEAGAPSQGWPSSTGAASVARGRLLAMIKDQKLNLAQDLAEYRKTSRMFASLAHDLVTTFRTLRGGRGFAEFIRILQVPRSRSDRRLANRWLQYQYGIRPVVSSLYGSADILRQQLQTGVYIRASRTAHERWSAVDKTASPFYREYFQQVSVRATARYKISSAAVKSLAEMGISNPLLLAWEVIPWTFVIDLIIPVGNWLSSLDALNGTSSLLLIETTRTTRFVVAEAYGGTRTYSHESYSRGAPSSSISMPKLGYQPSTSLTAVLNGLALLNQLRAPSRRIRVS